MDFSPTSGIAAKIDFDTAESEKLAAAMPTR
jgi:hypothetical protein